jgi:hypothetical protein
MSQTGYDKFGQNHLSEATPFRSFEMNNPQQNPQQPRQPGQQNEDERKRKEEEERKRKMRDGDQGKVGQDTDGDGKVVKPGQTPGQSGGRGLPDNR